MKVINFLLLIILVGLIIFAAINWHAITAPVALTFLFTKAEAPLGLILLSVTGLLTLLFLTFVIYMQSSTLVMRRKLNKEVEEQRKLANEAEASRYTELRTYLEGELEKLNTQINEQQEQASSRLTEIESNLQDKVEETGTSLSAYIGELEDRLQKP